MLTAMPPLCRHRICSRSAPRSAGWGRLWSPEGLRVRHGVVEVAHGDVIDAPADGQGRPLCSGCEVAIGREVKYLNVITAHEHGVIVGREPIQATRLDEKNPADPVISCDVALRLGCSDASKSIVATIALPEAGWYATTSWSWSVAPKRPAAKEAVPDVSPGRVMLDFIETAKVLGSTAKICTLHPV